MKLIASLFNTSTLSQDDDQSIQKLKEANYESAFMLVKQDLKYMHRDIRTMFKTDRPELKEICDYYFDGTGKAIRPMIICCMARVLSMHVHAVKNDDVNLFELDLNVRRPLLLDSQRQIALIAEIIHVASLIHDDIIDNSDLRRGKHSVNSQWGCHKAVLAGDFVLSVASGALARLGNTRVVETLSMGPVPQKKYINKLLTY